MARGGALTGASAGRPSLLSLAAAAGLMVAIAFPAPLGGSFLGMGRAAAAVAQAPDAAGVVWLCRPGEPVDPCAADRDATVVSPSGATASQPAPPGTPSPVDCFYVYPTVSRQPTANADLRVQPAETAVAVAQAARFSQVCNVWAPVYRQRTAVSVARGLGADPAADDVAFRSLLAAWRDYLANDNDGRPVVFVGHSQGAAMLIRLLRSQVDPDAALRARMVSALIIGGNVVVPTGRQVGGSFRHIPACRSTTQTGCVIAYSSFPRRPPPDSLFGRPGQGVSLQAGQRGTRGLRVLCTNPAALAGGTGALIPYFPAPAPAPAPGSATGAPPAAPWVEYPDLYAATCRASGSAGWLDVVDVGPHQDVRPRVSEALGPEWGYHQDDVNLALGNLVTDVSGQEASYLGSHRAG